MDWMMPVNTMLEDEITKITSSLLPPKFHGDVRTVRAVQESLTKLIDALGEQSAVAQGLNKVITTADKLRNSPHHLLYLLKDRQGNHGNGEIIGMLKVGRKHLFLFDQHDQVHEVEPMCVLDFYIVRDRQRLGFGRRLFDYMLADLHTYAWELAIDGPSSKMEQFLTRNYAIEKLYRQNNNFAIAPGFFERSDDDISGKKTELSTPTMAVGRFTAPKPASAIANVIHGPVYEEPSRRSPSPVEAGPSGRQSRRNDDDADASAGAGEWDDDWAEPSDEEEADMCEHELAAAERALAAASVASPPERPSTLRVQRGAADAVPPAGMPSAGPSAAGTPSAPGRRDSQLTDRGYFDVKYYHNRLW